MVTENIPTSMGQALNARLNNWLHQKWGWHSWSLHPDYTAEDRKYLIFECDLCDRTQIVEKELAS
jgi:hypothetical protein